MKQSLHPSAKHCTVCGRIITYRNQYKLNWATVEYCSHTCRINKHKVDNGYEQKIMELLKQYKTILPTDILPADQLHNYTQVELTRQAARRLVHAGHIEIVTMKNQLIDPSKFRGQIKLRLA